MNLNTKNIQRHNGIGFCMNKDGSRSAEFCGQTYTVLKVEGGWSLGGVVHRTLADVAIAIIRAY